MGGNLSEELTPEQLAFYRLLGPELCRRLQAATQRIESDPHFLRVASMSAAKTADMGKPSRCRVIEFPSARNERQP